MNEQEFAFRLMTFFIPYPLSRMLPRLLRRLFRGPSVDTPGNWAAAAFDSILKLYDDTAAAAESLLAAAEKMTPTDQLTDLISSLQTALDTALSLIDLLKDIIDNLDDYTPDQVVVAFNEVLPALDDLSGSTDDLAGSLPPVVIPAPPPYIPPLPPLYTGPPVPGPSGPTSNRRLRFGRRDFWFRDRFNIIDPAIWTDWSDGTGVCSIFNNHLKMESSQGGDYAYLETDYDDTIPSAFTFSFELNVVSGTGTLQIAVRTGTHHIWIYFDPPDTLTFRNQLFPPLLEYDVGNFMNQSIVWKFVYNGTTCDIYRFSTLVDSNCAIYALAGGAGARLLNCKDVLTVYLDNYLIKPN